MSAIRITVACPEALVGDANHFALVMGLGPDDGATYGTPEWRDGDGNLYSAASFEARPEWVAGAQAALARPAWDAGPMTVDMAAAGRAQAALAFWTPEAGGAPPQAAPGALTAVGGMEGLAALAAMGLEQVDEEAG